MGYVASSVQHCRETFLVYKLKFKMCLNSWSAWRLGLDSIEQSQSSSVIVGLGQERYAKKLIACIPLQVSISYCNLLLVFKFHKLTSLSSNIQPSGGAWGV